MIFPIGVAYFFPSYIHLSELPIVFLAGLIGEGYGTVVGGGGILIQFVLAALGVPLPVVVATDIAGSMGANFGVIAALPRTIWNNKKLLVLLTVPMFIGGIIGTLLLTHASTHILKDGLIIGLVLLLAYMLMQRKADRNRAEQVAITPGRYSILALVMVALGVYSNASAVGAATFEKVTLMSLLRLNFIDSLGLINITAIPVGIFSLVVTAYAGLLAWPYLIMLLLGSFIGGKYVTQYIRRIPDIYLRITIIIAAAFYLAYLVV